MSPFEQTTDEPTNEERAGRIDTVMQAYCLTLEGRDFDGDEDDVKDLLADLMHFCKRMEIDFEENLRVARNNYEHERNAESCTPNNLVCPVCGCFLEVSRTDTLLGIDREIFDCQSCDETFIRELTVADSPIERAVKCIGCGDMIPLSSSHIFYQSDGYAHYIGECCYGNIPLHEATEMLAAKKTIYKSTWNYHRHGLHVHFLHEEWRDTVVKGDTVLGYQQWVEHNLESLLYETDLEGVDAIEVAGCTDADGIVEVKSEGDAEFFSAYTHRPDAGVECICDFSTKSQATEFAMALAVRTGILVYGNLCSIE